MRITACAGKLGELREENEKLKKQAEGSDAAKGSKKT